MKVKKRTLLLIACLVWSTASFNILCFGCSYARQAPDDRKN